MGRLPNFALRRTSLEEVSALELALVAGSGTRDCG